MTEEEKFLEWANETERENTCRVQKVAWAVWEHKAKELAEAHNRIYDLLLGDDGQAHKEARRYLEKHAPELYKRLP